MTGTAKCGIVSIVEHDANINDLPTGWDFWYAAALQLYGSPRSDSVSGTILTTFDLVHLTVRLILWQIEFRLRPSVLAGKWKRTVPLIPQPGMADGRLSFQNYDEPDVTAHDTHD